MGEIFRWLSQYGILGVAVVEIDATGSSGNIPLTYSIAPTSGGTGIQTEIDTGKWLVPVPAVTDAVYTITVTDSGAQTDTIAVTVSHQAGSGGAFRYYNGTSIVTL